MRFVPAPRGLRLSRARARCRCYINDILFERSFFSYVYRKRRRRTSLGFILCDTYARSWDTFKHARTHTNIHLGAKYYKIRSSRLIHSRWYRRTVAGAHSELGKTRGPWRENFQPLYMHIYIHIVMYSYRNASTPKRRSILKVLVHKDALLLQQIIVNSYLYALAIIKRTQVPNLHFPGESSSALPGRSFRSAVLQSEYERERERGSECSLTAGLAGRTKLFPSSTVQLTFPILYIILYIHFTRPNESEKEGEGESIQQRLRGVNPGNLNSWSVSKDLYPLPPTSKRVFSSIKLPIFLVETIPRCISTAYLLTATSYTLKTKNRDYIKMGTKKKEMQIPNRTKESHGMLREKNAKYNCLRKLCATAACIVFSSYLSFSHTLERRRCLNNYI